MKTRTKVRKEDKKEHRSNDEKEGVAEQETEKGEKK